MPRSQLQFNATGLNETLRDFARFSPEGKAAAEDVLGKMWLDFDLFNTGGVVLKPGAGKYWPVRTGLSVKSWTPRIRGLNFVAINRTKDKKTGVNYAPFVHKAGRPTGEAVDEAAKEWVRLADVAAEDIADALKRLLAG